MKLTDLAGPRFQLAVERLAAGHPFTYDGVVVRIENDGALEVAVPSTWSIENVTTESAGADFRRADQVLETLRACPEFSDVTSGRPVRMILVHDYGNGAIALCTRTAAGLAWTPGLPRRR